MKGRRTFFLLPLLLCLLCVSFLKETKAAKTGDGVYIVYMGSASSARNANRARLMINTVLKRRGDALLQRYKHGFSGFAARLSAEEAKAIAKKPGVVSVFPDPTFHLHTTRSWDFLRYQTEVKIDSDPHSSASDASYDTIVGILDTGIWPESESFKDKDMGPIPSRWKGKCVEGKDFSASNCNRKIIGARFYKDPEDEDGEYNTSRDVLGHGSHVASTIAGTAVENASYYGLATGTAKGGAPSARLAIYKVCTPGGCPGSSILAAFDDAIADGVDVLSLSLGASAWSRIEMNADPIAIGAFHAVEQGITVICAAGNDGPSAGTVVNTAPWILTVAASSIDRDFESDVVLGGNKVIKGGGINFANISKSPVHPLIHGKTANKSSSEKYARNCEMDSLDGDMVKGKIVVCENVDGSSSAASAIYEVKSKGGIGCVFVDDRTRSVASNYGTFPMTVISSKDAAEIFSYLNSTTNPMATILPTITVEKFKPAPAIPYFSARGPTYITRNLLKPDIAAPGVAILAAWTGNDTRHAPQGKPPPQYNVISGTSMATPHVTPVAAILKSQHPTWGPSAIRSAIMTTAIQANNEKALITTETGAAATPYDYGAGELSTTAPLQPGLVYETTAIDYLNFLCYYGYDITKIKTISKAVPANFTCPEDSNADLISNVNYPSIAISSFKANQSRKVSRTVTNVGGDGETVYSASIEVPAGLNVQVTPEKLKFAKDGEKLTYQVTISAAASSSSLKQDVFGAITWSNGKYKVRSPLVVSSESSNSS